VPYGGYVRRIEFGLGIDNHNGTVNLRYAARLARKSSGKYIE
jgi:hypothetical protein